MVFPWFQPVSQGITEILVVSFLWLTQKGTQVSGSSSIAICGETAWMKAEETMG